MYLLSFHRFWTLSIERFWFLFWSVLNGVTLKTSNKRFLKQANSNKMCPSKAIARTIALSISTRFFFLTHSIECTWANQGLKRQGKRRPIVAIEKGRRSLVNLYRISMHEGMWILMIYLYQYLYLYLNPVEFTEACLLFSQLIFQNQLFLLAKFSRCLPALIHSVTLLTFI